MAIMLSCCFKQQYDYRILYLLLLYTMLPSCSTYIDGTALRVDGAESIYSASNPPTEHNNLPPFHPNERNPTRAN